MTVIRSCCCLAGMLAVLLMARAAVAAPNANSIGDSYGRGVHAYFSGNSAAAEQLFAQAMGEDPNAPRPYYFRALCLLRQGRSDEARSDFMIGATLEARSAGSYPVGKSLERVQGGDRLMLEQYRWRARAADGMIDGADAPSSYRTNAAMHTVTMNTVTMNTDVGALRQKVSVPLDRLVQPVSLAELANISAEMPAPAAPAAHEDPFADDPRPAAGGKIPSGKLLGILGRAIVEAAPMPSLEGLREQIPGLPAPAASGEAPAADDPFGSDAAVAPATVTRASDDPFGEPAPGDDAVESSPAESSEPPAEAAEEDPFG
ncbi:MAG: tetratricopeptide repeat protein [Pirellulales bacterium]